MNILYWKVPRGQLQKEKEGRKSYFRNNVKNSLTK